MQVSANFFRPGKMDQQRDARYCQENGINTKGMNYGQVKGAIVSDMTDGKLGQGFVTNRGPMDLMKDLQALADLGIEPKGNRAENKAAILNAMA